MYKVTKQNIEMKLQLARTQWQRLRGSEVEAAEKLTNLCSLYNKILIIMDCIKDNNEAGNTSLATALFNKLADATVEAAVIEDDFPTLKNMYATEKAKEQKPAPASALKTDKGRFFG